MLANKMSKVASAYSQTANITSVNSANSLELIILTYKRVFDYLKLGKKALEMNEPGVEEFTKLCDLINLGLIASLDKNKGGIVAENLELIYLWALETITHARLTKSSGKLLEVEKVLNTLYEGWVQLKA